MALIDDYAPAGGTITLTNASAAFTTAGATLQAAGVRAGDDIRIKGWVATIATVTGQNAGTLVEPWAQPTQTAQPLRIRYAPDQSRVQASVVDLLMRLASGNIDDLAALDLSVADRMLYTDAPNSLGTAPLTAFARTLLDDTSAGDVLSTLGFSAFFKSLVDDVNGTTLQTSIGGGVTGRALFTAANAGAAQDALGVSAFVKTLLDDADAAVARGTLGVTYPNLGIIPNGSLPPEKSDFATATVITDADTLAKTGWYQLGAPYTNGPTPNNYNILHVDAGGTAWQFTAAASNSPIFHSWWRAKSGGTWGAWRRNYDSQNSVANVSGTFELPTGGLMDQGNNANGFYWRFANRMQVCRSAVATPAGGQVTWTYPVAFAGTPTTVVTPTSGAARTVQIGTGNASSCDVLAFTSSGTPINVSIATLAIGAF